MFIASAIGPRYCDLRPLKDPECWNPESGDCFPVHQDLQERFIRPVTGSGGSPDPVVAHALAVASAYAYAEVVALGGTPNTLARMMTRLGMPASRVVIVADRIDAAFIVSSGFVIQSDDGRVVLVVYRGTEPFNVASWLTDADLHNGPVELRIGGEGYPLHPGFYRNVRATRSPIIEAVDRARRGLSVIDGEPVANPAEVVHLAGHSLGGAMAAILGLLLLNDPAYAPLAGLVRGVFGYGQPMIGSPELADKVAEHDQAGLFSRFEYRRDVVPPLPPLGLGRYAHFGAQYEVDPGGGFRRSRRVTRQATFLAIPLAPIQFVSHRLPLLRHIPFPYSLDDHLPLNYVQWLAPEGMAIEYGDYPAIS